MQRIARLDPNKLPPITPGDGRLLRGSFQEPQRLLQAIEGFNLNMADSQFTGFLKHNKNIINRINFIRLALGVKVCLKKLI
jgi:hypothetical protein